MCSFQCSMLITWTRFSRFYVRLDSLIDHRFFFSSRTPLWLLVPWMAVIDVVDITGIAFCFTNWSSSCFHTIGFSSRTSLWLLLLEMNSRHWCDWHYGDRHIAHDSSFRSLISLLHGWICSHLYISICRFHLFRLVIHVDFLSLRRPSVALPCESCFLYHISYRMIGLIIIIFRLSPQCIDLTSFDNNWWNALLHWAIL